MFHDTSLVAPFGPHGDVESEACAALGVYAGQWHSVKRYASFLKKSSKVPLPDAS